jgi:hypothetical protein
MEAWLRDALKLGSRDAEISFERPEADWGQRRSVPLVDLFLYALTPSAGRSAASLRTVRTPDGGYARQRDAPIMAAASSSACGRATLRSSTTCSRASRTCSRRPVRSRAASDAGARGPAPGAGAVDAPGRGDDGRHAVAVARGPGPARDAAARGDADRSVRRSRRRTTHRRSWSSGSRTVAPLLHVPRAAACSVRATHRWPAVEPSGCVDRRSCRTRAVT